jgi:hypothetical protein
VGGMVVFLEVGVMKYRGVAKTKGKISEKAVRDQSGPMDFLDLLLHSVTECKRGLDSIERLLASTNTSHDDCAVVQEPSQDTLLDRNAFAFVKQYLHRATT